MINSQTLAEITITVKSLVKAQVCFGHDSSMMYKGECYII